MGFLFLMGERFEVALQEEVFSARDTIMSLSILRLVLACPSRIINTQKYYRTGCVRCKTTATNSTFPSRTFYRPWRLAATSHRDLVPCRLTSCNDILLLSHQPHASPKSGPALMPDQPVYQMMARITDGPKNASYRVDLTAEGAITRIQAS